MNYPKEKTNYPDNEPMRFSSSFFFPPSNLARFNLWIMPSRNTADELKQIMSIRPNNNNNNNNNNKDDDHNKLLDPSPTSYPLFEPHITLASIHLETPIPLSTIRTSVVPPHQPAFPVEFGSVHVGDHYFRSVYIAVVLDETLKELRRAVHEALGVRSTTPCYPHMSLVYITDEDQERGRERERYFDELRRELISYDDGGSVGLRTPDLKSGWLKGSMMTEIWITKCVGPVETWEVLDKIILSQS